MQANLVEIETDVVLMLVLPTGNGDDPVVRIIKEGQFVWPILEDWRADPGTEPATTTLGLIHRHLRS
jgi:hypothetical protein